MTFTAAVPEKSRLRALLDHFATIEDPREPWRVAHPLPEVLLLVVCGTIADCDDYESIAGWGEAHLSFLRRFLPYHHGAPRARWLTMLMNRIDHPELFSAAFTAWVRQTWPDRPEFVAIDGKTSRRSHARAAGKAPLHLVSAFATTNRLVLGQEAVADKTNKTTAIPLLLARLAEKGGLQGTLVSIDAIATNPTIAAAIRDAQADYLLAVKANPTRSAPATRSSAPCAKAAPSATSSFPTASSFALTTNAHLRHVYRHDEVARLGVPCDGIWLPPQLDGVAVVKLSKQPITQDSRGYSGIPGGATTGASAAGRRSSDVPSQGRFVVSRFMASSILARSALMRSRSVC